jgi:hypothetical protein
MWQIKCYDISAFLSLNCFCIKDHFCIGATFEMRTVLYEIHLFNDKLVMHDRVFISKQIMRERARQRRDRKRERESVRDNALMEMRDGIGKKKIVRENIYGRCGRLI